jgi:hypothetical protein
MKRLTIEPHMRENLYENAHDQLINTLYAQVELRFKSRLISKFERLKLKPSLDLEFYRAFTDEW